MYAGDMRFSGIVEESAGIWNTIKEQVTAAFIVPLLPPEILRSVKKKSPEKNPQEIKDIRYNWDYNYTVALSVLGWSDREFWCATPRKFYSFLYNLTEIQTQAVKDSLKPQALVGKDAINALSQLASQIR